MGHPSWIFPCRYDSITLPHRAALCSELSCQTIFGQPAPNIDMETSIIIKVCPLAQICPRSSYNLKWPAFINLCSAMLLGYLCSVPYVDLFSVSLVPRWHNPHAEIPLPPRESCLSCHAYLSYTNQGDTSSQCKQILRNSFVHGVVPQTLWCCYLQACCTQAARTHFFVSCDQ